MKSHPLADIFPMMEGDDFARFASDVLEHGQREPIILLDGMILDGRNRFKACQEGNLEPLFKTFEGDDPLSFVLSLNLKRRHLDDSQRAMVADNLANMVVGGKQANSANLQNCTPVSRSEAARLLNVSERSVASAAAVRAYAEPELIRAVEQGRLPVSTGAQAARLAPKQQLEIAERSTAGEANAVRAVIKKEVRAVRESELGAKQAALPDAKFGVIVADPEWQFEPWSRQTGMDRAADNHYPTSILAVIEKRDVPSIAADDCVLFLWATAPMMPHALRVMEAWGFDYKSQFVWAKDRAGTGYWNRNQHELLLVGTRGHIPAPAPGTQANSVIEAALAEHSAKPDVFLELIERYFPTLPKIELNRRGPARPGWAAWGNEAQLDEVAA
jgi:N6-adenosine-specific RNA methylase IME4